MPGSVLIIDADEEFSGRLRAALDSRGVSVQVTGDGRAGLDMARINIPDAIVVCVELPRMSGYSICAKLKKDAVLKSVALVITSAEATQETFEHHKKLRNRAEEYLRKPFEPQALVDVLTPYLNMHGEDAGEVTIASSTHPEPEPPPSLMDDDDFGEDQFHFEQLPDLNAVDASVVVEPVSENAPDDAPDDSASAPGPELSLPEPVSSLPDPVSSLPAPLSVSGLPSIEHSPALSDGYEEDEAMTTIGVAPTPGTEALFKEIEQLRIELEAEREAHAQTVRERDEAVANESAAMQTFSNASPSQATREILALKKDLHDRDRQLLDRERELLAQRDREMEFESRLVQLQEQLEQSSHHRAELEGQPDDFAAIQAQQAELQSQIDQLRGELTEKERLLAANEDEIGALRESNQNLDAEVRQLSGELEVARSQTNRLDADLEIERQASESIRDALEATKASLVETEEQAARAFERIRRDGETKTKVRQALDIALRLLTESDDDNGVEEGTVIAEVHHAP